MEDTLNIGIYKDLKDQENGLKQVTLLIPRNYNML